MENKDNLSGEASDLLSGLPKSHSPDKEAGLNPIKRENDSLDDFEHLEHDTSPVKSVTSDSSSFQLPPPTDVAQIINTQATSTVESALKFAEEAKSEFDNIIQSAKENIKSTTTDTPKEKAMSSVGDLLGMDDDFKTSDKKTADLLGDFSYAPTVPPHSENFGKVDAFGDFDNFKSASQNFMDSEREEFKPQPQKEEQVSHHQPVTDLADRFSDSEPENEPEIHSSTEDLKISSKDDDFQFHKADIKQPETFKDVIEEPEIQPELPKRDYFEKEPSPVKEIKPEPVKIEEVVKTTPEPVAKPQIQPQPVVEPVCKLPTKSKNQEVMGAEAMFCKMGLVMENEIKVAAQNLIEGVVNGATSEFTTKLEKESKGGCKNRSILCVLFTPNAWFNPERLNPKVERLIYWREPKKSGAVFGGTLVVLLSLAYFSFISVTAYLSLFSLAGTILFRIYKNVLQAVQKTSDGHPFKEQLEADITLPQEKVREVTDIAVTHVNAAVTELRRLFLVEDLVDSIKFGVLLWCLTYVGAWFNGMTLIIIAFVALFTLPKVYENNKQQIDANLDIVRTKVAEITSKVKAAIPIGKKSEEKKE